MRTNAHIMKTLIKITVLFIALSACQTENNDTHYEKISWENRKTESLAQENILTGKTYLPVYSHIYHRYDKRTFDLTITVSIRNTSETDSIYLLKADYYNTKGHNIRQYINDPIFIKPMETIEIVIAEKDTEGGSGANFMFKWGSKSECNLPLFEAVMISTHGQQGLSFTTRGVHLKE